MRVRYLQLILLALAAFYGVPRAYAQQTVVATCGTASYTAGSSANETQNTNGQTCS